MTCYLIFNFRPTNFSYFRKITAISISHNVKKEVGPNGSISVVKGLITQFLGPDDTTVLSFDLSIKYRKKEWSGVFCVQVGRDIKCLMQILINRDKYRERSKLLFAQQFYANRIPLDTDIIFRKDGKGKFPSLIFRRMNSKLSVNSWSKINPIRHKSGVFNSPKWYIKKFENLLRENIAWFL